MDDKSQHPRPYIPATSYNPNYPPPPQPQQNVPQPQQPQLSWFQRNQVNKPQSNSVGIASLIFLSGGMNMAYSIGVTSYIPFNVTQHLLISWFIAAIIGSIIGAVVVNFLSKKVIMLSAAILVLIGGILFAALPKDYHAIVAARYLDGIANGLVFVASLVMAGEEAIASMRGTVSATVEALSFSLGIFLQLLFTSVWTQSVNNEFSISQLHGILSIVYGALALLMGFCFVIESPVFLLLRDQEQPAIDALRRLQRPFIVTQQTYAQLEEHKRYIADNREMSRTQALIAGLPALLKLCLYRSMVALSFSNVVYSVFFISSTAATRGATWPYIVVGACRVLGVCISAFMMDSVGRKKPLLCGMLICGGMAIGIGVIFGDLWNLLFSNQLTAALYLLFVYQFFAGVALSASSSYLTEAFPLAVKPYYIACAFVCELLVQIIVSTCDKTLYSMSDYFYAVGALSLVFFVFGILCLPETKGLTLREAQGKFRQLLSTGF